MQKQRGEEETLPTEGQQSWADVAAGSTAGTFEEARPPKFEEKQRIPSPTQPEQQLPQFDLPEEKPPHPPGTRTYTDEFPTLAEAEAQTEEPVIPPIQEQEVPKRKEKKKPKEEREKLPREEHEEPVIPPIQEEVPTRKEKKKPKEEREKLPREEVEGKAPPKQQVPELKEERKKPREEEKRKKKKQPSEKQWDVPERKPTQEEEPKKRIELDFIGRTTVAELLKEIHEDKPKQLVTMPSDLTVQRAVELLANHKILSAPVQDAETKQWLGVVDMFDILRYVMKLYQAPFEEAIEEAAEEEEEEEKEEEPEMGTTEEEVEGVVYRFINWFTQLFGVEPTIPEPEDKMKKKFLQDSIREVLQYSRYPKEITVAEDAVLPQVISMFASGLRRIVMKGENGQVTNVISQWDIVTYLYKHLDELKELGEKSLESLGFVFGDVLCIREYAEAVHGFFMMDNNHVSAVAVVDTSGKLVGNLSVSDLRGLTSETFGALKLPVMEYLKTHAGHATRIPPVVVTPTQTFQGLIELFLENRVHRLWIVDKAGKAIGLVSLTDVMRLIDNYW